MPGILIVEDHAFFSQALVLVLGQRLAGGPLGRATFSRSTTAAEGLRLVAEAGPFALAVVDLMLPDGDGTDVVRAVKGRWPETRRARFKPPPTARSGSPGPLAPYPPSRGPRQ